MNIVSLNIADLWLLQPREYRDERGLFLEAYKREAIREVTGRDFDCAQVNLSSSVEGTVRGIHFAAVPPGQAKYVMCVSGAVQDIVVDLRIGSPTFGHSESVQLDDRNRHALLISEGLGHGFCALSATATVVYLCSRPFTPSHEFGVNPLDPDLDLPWPRNLKLVLSDKDESAPSLEEAAGLGILPSYPRCAVWYDTLRIVD